MCPLTWPIFCAKETVYKILLKSLQAFGPINVTHIINSQKTKIFLVSLSKIISLAHPWILPNFNIENVINNVSQRLSPTFDTSRRINSSQHLNWLATLTSLITARVNSLATHFKVIQLQSLLWWLADCVIPEREYRRASGAASV